MTYQIEEGVPFPGSASGRPSIYPVRELEVGQSFFVPLGDRKVLSVVCSRIKKLTGRDYTVRRVEGGIRVWRTA
jgi:hypothetical protein